MSAPSSRSIPGCDFTEAVRQVQQWVAHGFYPGAALLLGRQNQLVVEEYDDLFQ